MCSSKPFCKTFFCVLVVSMLFSYTGCAPVLIGVGAVSGYMLSNDAATGEVTGSYSTLWNACIDRLEAEGVTIMESIESDGLIRGERAKEHIVVKIESLNSNVQRLKVAARKYLIPKPYVAQDIFVKIVKDLE